MTIIDASTLGTLKFKLIAVNNTNQIVSKITQANLFLSIPTRSKIQLGFEIIKRTEDSITMRYDLDKTEFPDSKVTSQT